MSDRSGHGDIWTVSADGGPATAIMSDAPWDGFPVWSPDGSMIAFHSDRGGSADIWVLGPTQVAVEPSTWGAIKAAFRQGY
jgi:Tol biopolymer transport system component